MARVIDPDLLAAAAWTTPPAATEHTDDGLRVTAVEGSDAWRHTSYGFVHDDAHALLAPFGARDALEVAFRLDYTEQFDQAGLVLRAGPEEWVKAGVEVSDGVPQVGAVVTHGTSDWSVAPVPDWAGRTVTVRASRDGDAVTLRARVDDEPFRLVRVAHVDSGLELRAGPYCCAPTRAGLTVLVTGWQRCAPDDALH
ncbi:hypothetical protein ASG36_16525 [Geodermatophilus sp. Leaf369]|uniref:DUF1349 domain-containing protein n=1 Tax=Geodermatophilus sp. Leaf369 TaxID=1736354 RepID=UPI0006F87691|nr:DUF1349 domain-containing protein [Geodermatophilus sp. Leaf369]KQS56669.1 hypothetical protein ASG36_16525 [Geodermatophilus sp. Leaf369]